jgi:hypothetical protein
MFASEIVIVSLALSEKRADPLIPQIPTSHNFHSS